MSEDTLRKFMDSDPSGNFKYLDWMLFQAGGGQDAMLRSLQMWDGESAADLTSLRNQCRTDFIEDQIKGGVDALGLRRAYRITVRFYYGDSGGKTAAETKPGFSAGGAASSAGPNPGRCGVRTR